MTTLSHRAAHDLTRIPGDPNSTAVCPGLAAYPCPRHNPRDYTKVATHRADTPGTHLDVRAAAEQLERSAIGEEGETRDRVVARILRYPEYAFEVYRQALAFTRSADERSRVRYAGVVLGITR